MIAQKGRFTVAFSGGSLPKAVAPGLVARMADIEWDKWHVFFADERFVPLDHADSNYFACKEVLFDAVPIPPSQIYTIETDGIEVDEAARRYQEKLLEVIGDFKHETGAPK